MDGRGPCGQDKARHDIGHGRQLGRIAEHSEHVQPKQEREQDAQQSSPNRGFYIPHNLFAHDVLYPVHQELHQDSEHQHNGHGLGSFQHEISLLCKCIFCTVYRPFIRAESCPFWPPPFLHIWKKAGENSKSLCD